MSTLSKKDDIFARVVNVAAKVLAGSAFSKVCLIVVEFFLAAYLGAQGYGLFSIAFAFLLVASSLAQVGLNYGVIQYISVYTDQHDERSKAAVARVSLVLVFFVALLFAATLHMASYTLSTNVFGRPEMEPLLRLVAWIIPLEALNQCASAVFRGYRKFRFHVVAQDLARNLSFLACIPLLLGGVIDGSQVLLVLGAGAMLGSLVSIFGLRRLVPFYAPIRSDFAILSQLLSFSYPLFLWQALQKTANEMMVLIAGAVLAPASVGILALAVRMLTLLNFPQSVINATTPVEFASFNYRKDYESIRHLAQMLAVLLSLIALAFVYTVGLNADRLFSLFGPEYESFGWVLQVLLIAKSVDVGSGPIGQILIACRKRGTVLALGVADVFLQFLLVVPLMYLYGLPGAAVGNALRSLLILSARHFLLYMLVDVYVLSRTLMIVWSTGVVTASGCWLAAESYPAAAATILVTTLALSLLVLVTAHVWRSDPHFAAALKSGIKLR